MGGRGGPGAPDCGAIEFQRPDSRSPERRHGRAVQMIFQTPSRAMNPGMRVLEVIADRSVSIGAGPKNQHQVVRCWTWWACRPSGKRYPHEFSGGQRQRIASPVPWLPSGVIVMRQPVSSSICPCSYGGEPARRPANRRGMALVFS